MSRDGAPNPADWALSHAWLTDRFVPGSAEAPFSFVYDGQRSQDLLPRWPVSPGTPEVAATFTQQAYSGPEIALSGPAQSALVVYRQVGSGCRSNSAAFGSSPDRG